MKVNLPRFWYLTPFFLVVSTVGFCVEASTSPTFSLNCEEVLDKDRQTVDPVVINYQNKVLVVEFSMARCSPLSISLQEIFGEIPEMQKEERPEYIGGGVVYKEKNKSTFVESKINFDIINRQDSKAVLTLKFSQDDLGSTWANRSLDPWDREKTDAFFQHKTSIMSANTPKSTTLSTLYEIISRSNHPKVKNFSELTGQGVSYIKCGRQYDNHILCEFITN